MFRPCKPRGHQKIARAVSYVLLHTTSSYDFFFSVKFNSYPENMSSRLGINPTSQ